MRSRIGVGVLIVAAAVTVSPSSRAGADLVPLVGDAYSGGASTGSKKTLVVKGSGSVTTFLQFDLSTAPGGPLPAGTSGSHVTKATLILGVNKVSVPGSFNVVRVVAPWTEATVGAGPALGAVAASAVPLAASDGDTFKAVDVTLLVRDWVNGTANYGLAVAPNDANVAATFDSKESTSTSHVAQLDIVLTGENGANTALGTNAMQYAAGNAGNNTALGYQALKFVGGTNNVAVGTLALEANPVGYFNTAVGSGALGNSTGSSNVAVGYAANGGYAPGDANTALGGQALLFNSGNFNIGLGHGGGQNLTFGSNNIAIGNLGVAGESGTIRIGNVAHTATYVAGISGAVSAGGVAVFVDAAGKLGTTVSSARFKDGVRDMGSTSSALMQLRPVTFRYKPEVDASGGAQYGLVAEEVAKVAPDLVVLDDDGRPQAVRYHFVYAMMLNEMQKQSRQIQDLTARLEMLSARLMEVESVVVAPSHGQASHAGYSPAR